MNSYGWGGGKWLAMHIHMHMDDRQFDLLT
eukprot:COSAG06_NODE_22214_length_730_cov_1.435816_2_plen_29_part_01